MNVFEDLIVELKEENLLERTVIDDNPEDDGQKESADHLTIDLTVPPEERSQVVEPDVDEPVQSKDARSEAFDVPVEAGEEILEVASPEETDDPSAIAQTPTPLAEPAPLPKKPRNGREFYQKRAMGEVSNLQMVEHVLTGVEREYLKVLPKTFDDFATKKALHAFLHVSDNENSPSHQEAEFALMHETEAWCTALAERDRKIPVSSLRHYCENSKPALSSQALLALARFYRNLPYSELVRAKFDFVITRLFSRPAPAEKRLCLFTRDETLTHINTLYKDWSSISLYAADDDDSKIMLTALSFEDLAVEAENASSFDQLIKTDFFGRLRLFKESISELFYAPNVTAAAIEGNIRIGNAYVDLITRERQKMDAESIQSKYGDLHDDAVSEAAGRTLGLVELLRQLPDQVVEPENQTSQAPKFEFNGTFADDLDVDLPEVKTKKVRSKFFANIGEKAANANKWLLAFSALIILASVGIYVWANFFVTEDIPSASVKSIETDNAAFKEFVKTIKQSGDNYYVLLQPNWDVLPKEKRQEVLQKIYQSAVESGAIQVTLLNKDGKTAGFASATRLDVIMP